MTRLSSWVRQGLLALCLVVMPAMVLAAPFAAYVMDARTGEVLYETNSGARLHPASLTKMMTLYIAFQAIERGEITLDTKVKITSNAANQAPSRIGLKPGQSIALRYLIRAAAIKSANDAATAIGEAISGSEPKFAARMTQTAKSLGMNDTTFKNANGLTASGHLSTAHDMTVLGRRLFYDFPQYYNIFSRKSADAGIATVYSHNRILSSYKGADGIKTGFTNAAGFNLTASAERDGVRIVATVLGGTSTPARDNKMKELLDLGFARAPKNVKEKPPASAALMASGALDAPAGPETTQDDEAGGAGKIIRMVAAVDRSPRPPARPGTISHDADAVAAAVAAAQASVVDSIALAMAEAPATTAPAAVAVAVAEEAPVLEAALAEAEEAVDSPLAVEAEDFALAASPRPVLAPRRLAAVPEAAPVQMATAEPAPVAPTAAAPADSALPAVQGFAQTSAVQPETLKLAAIAHAEMQGQAVTGDTGAKFVQSTAAQPETAALAAPKTPGTMILTGLAPAAAPQREQEVVARISTSGGRNWSINLGKYPSQFQAERVLLQTALVESDTLGDALRKVAHRPTGFEANFVGLTEDMATLACRRLVARTGKCEVVGP
ncbi:D-alanyl-D-alanine carboxypeptidase family protein [Phaeovulum sp. W22_SRMD_FR3]|uniref:D-alanyl-D-alanine carboxypeptidase family protein n=1 Tax=Phaeovulum sp. W22_SRMD_FR3 TaxID=3240274 RepID=UPI003F95F69D